MTSPVSICSQALLLLGAQTINSFDEPFDRAKIASNLYPDEKKALLRLHPWNCCIRRVVLAPEVTAPAFGYSHSFVLPGDCVRVLNVGDDYGWPEDYQVEGRRILYSGTVLPLRYVAEVDESEWDDTLVRLMKLAMVAAMAYPITKSGTVADGAKADFERELKRARAIDGQENPPEEIVDSPLLAARRRDSDWCW
ncbi:hypothetical protein [Eleftheria terrae]|uniref:hypothetical protein n=1 Tax=Eleftheria terrae TaxID=1597781 RepID=UPI00263A5C43|nr:hypothetical protein [Eleftheria terrae]WKB53019.1 hypothetical protein N7L95_01030 [Eleftheria terrae]